jgi:hypothetical protein
VKTEGAFLFYWPLGDGCRAMDSGGMLDRGQTDSPDRHLISQKPL